MLKIKTIRKVITPELGTLLAGYPRRSAAIQIHDDLLISGLAFDDGSTRALLLSFDLLGLEEETIRRIKKDCAKICDIDPDNVLLTCTAHPFRPVYHICSPAI